MEPNNNQPVAPQAPEIPESEMKMPEDQFGNRPAAEPAPKHIVNPLFIVALILLLTVLAVVVIWGEELVGMFLPETTVELEPLREGTEMENDSTETELNEMERELNEMNLSNMEENLNMIEAEMDAELESKTEAEM